MGEGARIIGGIEVHPAADLFPLMEGDDYERLKQSIAKHGIRVPLTFCDGKVLDGRNRLRAYVDLGLPLARLPREGITPSTDPYAYAWDRNCERFQYGEAQRAAIRTKVEEASGELVRVRADAEAMANAARSEALKGKRNAAKDNPKNSAAARAAAPVPRKRGSPEARHIAEKANVSVDTASRVLALKEKDPVAFEHLAATGELPKPPPKPQPKPDRDGATWGELRRDWRRLARYLVADVPREEFEHIATIYANASPNAEEP